MGNKKGGKNGGGGGGKKKKKKEQEVKDSLTEVDKEYYELQLVDLNRKLTRLQGRSAELETSNAELGDSLSKLDEDRSDIIAYLKKALHHKTNEMVELEERLHGLKQSTDGQMVRYKDEIAHMKQEYRNVREELTSEIKLLMGKLNSLEEFRTQKEELTAKFATQEQEIREQEKRHERELYEYEKKFILEKEKLKRQMETRLLRLSMQFQEATDVRIAAATHRMIRENIAMNNEMTTMQETQKEMMECCERIKSRNAELRLEMKVVDDEKDRTLRKNLALVKIIDKLASEHEKYEARLAEMSTMERERGELRRELERRQAELEAAKEETSDADADDKFLSIGRASQKDSPPPGETVDRSGDGADFPKEGERAVRSMAAIVLLQIKMLGDRLSTGQSHATKLYAEVAALKLNSRRLNNTLHKAVAAVKEAVRLHEEPDGADEALVASKRHALLGNLLQLLNRAEMAEKEHATSHRIPGSYEAGDLGFVPRAQ